MEWGFWEALDALAREAEPVIDRPRGSVHPQYSHIVDPLDYGYLENTASMDGEGIDIWRGSRPEPSVDGIICTVDLLKRDSEIKILLGCTAEEQALILRFHTQSNDMRGLLVTR